MPGTTVLEKGVMYRVTISVDRLEQRMSDGTTQHLDCPQGVFGYVHHTDFTDEHIFCRECLSKLVTDDRRRRDHYYLDDYRYDDDNKARVAWRFPWEDDLIEWAKMHLSHNSR